MSDLSNDIDNLRKKYREIFLKSSEELNNQIEKIKPQDACMNCNANCGLKQDIFELFPENCVYKNWQKEVIELFDEVTLKNIYQKWMKILEYKNNSNCAKCASCCKLACSEFSYDELKQKAKNGDNFAWQFISVFIPYENESEAREIYPEYFELLKNKIQDEKVYFYHCSKVTEDNLCPDYENRPQICKDFPDNPIEFLPKSCGYSRWKEEVEPVALMLRSMLEIIDFYKQKIGSLEG